MHCRPFRVEIDGKVMSGFACGSRSRAKPCKCGRKSTKLCDHPLTGKLAGKTCDAPLCDHCSTSAGPDRDLCPVHVKIAKDEVQP
jgi:hypothetical protein